LAIALQAQRIAIGMIIPPITRLQLTRNPLGDGYAANAASDGQSGTTQQYKRLSDRGGTGRAE
jgi:hypothetical protein